MLESLGHKVTSLDLMGSGINPTDPNTVYAFEDYNEPFIDVMENLPDKEQVILVAHSAGGQSVTEYRFATMLLRPGPVRALRGDQVKFIRGEDVDSVPRAFIKTLHDHNRDANRML
ncbi:hypothetical protein QQ045_006780 [Rhodiola kirilowii]